jgi:uncharacterized protein YbbK (DUF523 family)
LTDRKEPDPAHTLPRVLVSACLLGEPVRYNAGNVRCRDERLARWLRKGWVVSFCPEVAAGLPVPRPCAELQALESGAGVLRGTGRVVDAGGNDVTEHFIHGAELALETTRIHGISVAVLKEGSPSCGTQRVYDGSFSGHTIPGCGVTTARLGQSGIAIFNEHELVEADTQLQKIAVKP